MAEQEPVATASTQPESESTGQNGSATDERSNSQELSNSATKGADSQPTTLNLYMYNSPLNVGKIKDSNFVYGQQIYGRQSTTAKNLTGETQDDYIQYLYTVVESSKDTKFVYGHDVLQDSGSPSEGEELFNAAAIGNILKVRDIIESHPDAVGFQNKQSQSPLQVAAFCGRLNVVEVLVEGKAPLEQHDEYKNTPLALAVLGNEPAVVEHLLRSGCMINAQNKKGLTPLHTAVINGHVKCAEVLLTSNHQRCDVNIKNSNGDTALFIAIARNDLQHVQLLVEHPEIDLTLTNNRGVNCLHLAASYGNNEFVKVILKTQPSLINTAGSDGNTALHLAVINKHTDVVLTLVERENCDKNKENVIRHSPLSLAVDSLQSASVEALVNNGADINAQDKDGNTALHVIVGMVFEGNLLCDPLIAKDSGATPLFLAFRKVNKQIMKLLVGHRNVNLNVTDNNGFNCLHQAASLGNTYAIKRILEAAPTLLNSRTKNDDSTALHLATLDGYIDAMQTLMAQQNCDIDCKTVKGETPLHLAAKTYRCECVEALLKRGADVNIRDKDGNTGLHLVSVNFPAVGTISQRTKDHKQIIQQMVKHPGVNLNVTNNISLNCLQHAAYVGNTNAVQTILEAAPSLINVQRSDGRTALHIATQSGFEDIVHVLVTKGNCMKDLQDINGQTPLHLAAQRCLKGCIFDLVSNGADVNVQDVNGQTSLHHIFDTVFQTFMTNISRPVATKKGDDKGKLSLTMTNESKQIIQLLVEHPKVDLKLENTNEFNCLHYAVFRKNDFAVEMILRVAPVIINFQRSDGVTALHTAALNGDSDIVLTLVKQDNCQKNLKTVEGRTALHLAVDGCFKNCIKALVNNGADVNIKDNDGNTSLHLATTKVSIKSIVDSRTVHLKANGDTPLLFEILKNNTQIIQLMVEHPTVDLTLKNKKGFNCLHYAAIHGNNFAVESILKGDPSMINIVYAKDEGTALHLAALNGHTDVVWTFVKHADCDRDFQNVSGQTPLHLAVEKCNKKCVKAVVDNGANVNVQDRDGDTALHLVLRKAITEKTSGPTSIGKDSDGETIKQVTQLLVEHPSADLTLKNSKGFSCLHYAAINGNNFGVERMVNVDPQMINIIADSFTALHIAALLGHSDVVLTLAKQGICNKDLQNVNGQTALHLAVTKGHYQCMEALLRNGANVNARDKDGNTSLHLAMMKAPVNSLSSMSAEKMLDVVQEIEDKGKAWDETTKTVAVIVLLVKSGADKNLLNNHGRNVFDVNPNLSVVWSQRKDDFERIARRATGQEEYCKVS